jgi:putative transposase
MRTTQRYQPTPRPDEAAIRQRVIELASKYGRYGYRLVWGMMRDEGYEVNHKRVYRIWREEGLKVPKKQPKRARLWLSEGSTIRLRPERKNHVWSYDFVTDQTYNGRKFRVLNIIDEYSRECLACHVARRITANDVLFVLSQLFIKHGVPEHLRSDNGPEFVAKHLRTWLADLNVQCSFITPGSPWENGYIESFNGRMRAELLNGEIFFNLYEAKVLIERWRSFYNTIRPHSSLGYRPPVPESIQFTSLQNAA